MSLSYSLMCLRFSLGRPCAISALKAQLRHTSHSTGNQFWEFYGYFYFSVPKISFLLTWSGWIKLIIFPLIEINFHLFRVAELFFEKLNQILYRVLKCETELESTNRWCYGRKGKWEWCNFYHNLKNRKRKYDFSISRITSLSLLFSLYPLSDSLLQKSPTSLYHSQIDNLFFSDYYCFHFDLIYFIIIGGVCICAGTDICKYNPWSSFFLFPYVWFQSWPCFIEQSTRGLLPEKS